MFQKYQNPVCSPVTKESDLNQTMDPPKNNDKKDYSNQYQEWKMQDGSMILNCNTITKLKPQ